MFVAFIKGEYTFLILKSTLSDLGIKKEHEENFVCEYKQDCRHVLFIPIFPIRKYWEITNEDGAEVLSSDILHRLEDIEGKYWYYRLTGWIGTFLIMIFLTSYISFNIYEEWSLNNKRQESINTVFEHTLHALQYPSNADYYKLNFGENELLTAKVNRVLKDSIQFVLYESSQMQGSYSEKEQLVSSTIENIVRNSFWVKRNDLLTLYTKQDSLDGKPIEIRDRNFNKLFVYGLISIQTIAGPLLEVENMNRESNEYKIMNNGFEVRIDSMKNLNPDCKWIISLNKNISRKESFIAIAKGKGSLIIYCSDSTNKYQIILDNNNRDNVLQINGDPKLLN